MENINVLISLLTIVTAVGAFTEWRVRVMQSHVLEKIKDTERLNEVIQGELKLDIARLEAKIDMLINLQIQKASHVK